MSFFAFTLYFFFDNQAEANSVDSEKAAPLNDHCRPFCPFLYDVYG